MTRANCYVCQIILAMIVVTFSLRPSRCLAAEEADCERMVIIRFEETFGTLSEQYLYRKLEKAREEKADVVVFEITSHGGRVDVMERLIDYIRDIQWAKTVAYVPSYALSAAALTSLACDEIVIGRKAVFGDAGVIRWDTGLASFKHAPEKARTHVVRLVRDLAEARGRPPALAEAMVDMDVVVFEVKNQETGESTYMSEAEIESLENGDQWEKRNPIHESRKGSFLEVNGPAAVDLGLADAVVGSHSELQSRYGAEEYVVLERTGVDTTVLILNNPFVTGLLFIVGLVALYFEFASPGIGLGGLTSIVCFSLFFWSRFLGGTAEWLEVMLFLAGIALIGVEIFVIPGFGIWGLSGLLLMASSLILASQDFVLPNNADQWNALTRSAGVVLGSMVAFLIAAMVITAKLGSVPLLSRLALNPPTAEGIDGEFDMNSQPPVCNAVGVGDEGFADSFLRPAGKARFGDEIVDVVSDGTFIDARAKVRVTKVEGNTIVVREVV